MSPEDSNTSSPTPTQHFNMTLESSSSSDSFETSSAETTIGLSDIRYAGGRRKMLDLVNRLHATGYADFCLTSAREFPLTHVS